MVKLLIVEDSKVLQDFLTYIFETDAEIEVIGKAGNGIEAVKMAQLLKPDIITMDINMPEMNGIDATKEIMASFPVPIIIISGSQETSVVERSFEALEAGALVVLSRPAGLGHPAFESSSKELIKTVKLLSEVKVVRRWNNSQKLNRVPIEETLHHNIKLIAIGASTGGPQIIHSIISRLPSGFSIPVLIVQHMSPGFIAGFIEWLNQSSKNPVISAAEGITVQPGTFYVAPDYLQMGITKNGMILLNRGLPVNGHCPSISYLFKNVADNYGKNAMGIILTGMGVDGTKELKLLKDNRGLTVVQDKETAAVYGMPGEAIKLNASSRVLSPYAIADLLIELDKSNNNY